MLILALESSAKAASAALCRDGALLAQTVQNNGLTHSRTLLPMVDGLLRGADLRLDQLDAVAVACGPGSFTGVRIGVSTVKGLCWGAGLPAVGVSTLEAMAWHGAAAPDGAVICCAMDARRGQIYNALFTFSDGAPQRLCPDRAISLDELCAEIKNLKKTIFIVGDGARLCYNQFLEKGLPALLVPAPLEFQSAWGVAMAAARQTPQPAERLLPVYLRLSQAERERQARMG